MKSALLALMFSGVFSSSVFLISTTAFAQSSPDTRQTDQSEEDWRKSKKKSGDTDDILDIIKNTRGSGVGNGRGFSPIDALPEESRRHLIKERAKRLAQAGPGEPVDVSYTPSEAAKSDPDLQSDEQAAWKDLSRSISGTPQHGPRQGQGNQGQGGQGQQSQQNTTTPSGSQSGGSSGQNGNPSDSQQTQSSSPSVMRGGSSASVSDILSQIKGRNGSSSNGSNTGSGQVKSQEQGLGQAQAEQNQGQGQEQAQAGQNQSQAQSQSQAQDTNSDSVENGQSQAHGEAHAQQNAQQQTRKPEAITPLDRLKNSRKNDSRSGARSSASDFLKTKN